VLRQITLAIVLLPAAVTAADDWPWPQQQVFGSAHGFYGFRVTPPQPGSRSAAPSPSPFGRSQAVLFKPGADGKDVVFWKRELVNAPHRALVTDDGKYAVTLDTWGRVGFEHSLVIYGEQGRIVADLNLEALLSREAIANHVVRSVSSRWWLREGSVTFDENSETLTIALKWGTVLRVTLATGAVR
jgi:hypothetical protein